MPAILLAAVMGLGVMGLGAVGLGALGAAPAGAGPPGQAPPAPAPPDEGGRVLLASQSAWTRPGDDLVLGLRVIAPAPLTLTVAATICQRVSSRSEFALTLQDKARCAVVSFVEAPVAQLAANADGTVTMVVGSPERPPAPGVYPVRVELRAADGHELDHLITHLVAVGSPSPDSRLGFSWVLPVHAPPSTAPDGSHQVDPGTSARLGALVSAVAEHPTVALDLRPTPDTLEALAASAREDDAASVRTLFGEARSAPATRQLVAATYVPLDLVAVNTGGLQAEETAQVVRGDEALDETIGARPDPRTWVADGRLNASAVSELADRGVDRLVLPEETLTPATVRRTVTQPFSLQARQGRRLSAVAGDAGLAAHFTGGDDQVLAAHQFLADLAVIYFDAPGSRAARAVVAVTPRSWPVDGQFLRVALDALANSPVVAPLTLDDVFTKATTATAGGSAPTLRTLAPTPIDLDAVLPAEKLRAARRRLDLFGSLLDHDNEQAQALFDNLEHSLLTTESADLGPKTRSIAVDAVGKRLERQLRLVKVPASRTVTLTARRGEIPITVFSDATFPLHVVLKVQSEKLRFPSGSTRELDLSRRNTTERFTVQARTSGAFPLRVTVESPSGELLGFSRFTVRSTAASGVGVVLSVGAGLFLMVWWGRNLRHGRRAGRLVPA